MFGFKTGDVVMFKTDPNQQKMTVAEVRKNAVKCNWFIGSDQGGWSSKQSGWFTAAELRRTRRGLLRLVFGQ